jgi:hypothetical protein
MKGFRASFKLAIHGRVTPVPSPQAGRGEQTRKSRVL